MKKYILILLIFIPFFANAQVQKVESAKAIADSILKAKVGNRLIEYFFDGIQDSYFTNADTGNKRKLYKYPLTKKIPKKFNTLNFIYTFSYNKIEGVDGAFEIILNQDFKLERAIDLSFIPDFLINNTTPNFISKDSALAVVNQNLNEGKCELLEPTIAYLKEDKKFVYKIIKKLSKHPNKKLAYNGELEVILLNAYIGNLEYISRGYLGLFYK